FLSLLRYSSSSPSFFLVLRRPPAPTLFPYTTLFRSARPQDVPWLNLCSSHRRSSRPRSAAVSACTPPRDAATWSSSVDTGTNQPDRKSTRLNSSHVKISYAVFCLKKKKKAARQSRAK